MLKTLQIGISSLVLFTAVNAGAVVKLTTERAHFQSSDAYPLLLEQIRSDVRRGVYDSKNLRFPVKSTSNAKQFVTVSSVTFAQLPARLQDGVVKNLASLYDLPNFGSYKVSVDTTENNLNDEPLIASLGIKIKDLAKMVPAEKLLSEYAQKWAYQYSQKAGANCWHTSISSINPNWSKPRRMLPPEFLCHLRTAFEPIDAPSEWGDLIRLAQGGEEVHGFTFLGVDKNDPTKKIVFTKNGYAAGYFQFMDFETVTQIYSGTTPTYYRRVRAAIDPKEDSSAPCAKESVSQFGLRADVASGEKADPILEAGLRLKPASTFAPIE